MLLRVTVCVHNFSGEEVQRALDFKVNDLLESVRERSLDDSADHLDKMRIDEVVRSRRTLALGGPGVLRLPRL